MVTLDEDKFGASFNLEITVSDLRDVWKVRCRGFGPAWLLLPHPAEEERSERAALSVLCHPIINLKDSDLVLFLLQSFLFSCHCVH